MSFSPGFKIVAVATLLAILTSSSHAADNPVKLTKKWTGSVADAGSGVRYKLRYPS